MQRLFFLFITGWLFVNFTHAQVNQPKLDRLFTKLEKSGDFNGSVLVARGEEILYERYLGYANYETQQPITGNTVFELASAGKQFTAMGIMILAEQGKLTYDDLVAKYLPGFPYAEITIRHLLNMASGIPDYLAFADQLPTDSIATNQFILDFYTTKAPPLKFPPHTKFSYSNVNYVFLASIITKVSQQPFAVFLEEQIFAPAGMVSTRSYTSKYTQQEVLPDYAQPYVMVSGQLVKPGTNSETGYVVAASGIEGDGSIVSTPYDLLKWTKGLKENTFISEATLKEAYRAPTFRDGTKGKYGFGIYLGKNSVWHWGSWAGVQTSYTRYLSDDTVAIYLKNVESNNWSWVGKFEQMVRN